jgi:NAD(P)H dehydrogenase (quinone)
MNISLILGHPRQNSFCHAIAATARATLHAQGHTVVFHDLYAEGFHPLLTAEESLLITAEASRTRVSDDVLVAQHCTELQQAEGLIIVHPNWWGQPPAMLKGWIDRVIRPGVAYDIALGEGGPTLVGRLQVQTALICTTSDAPRELEQGQFGNTLDILWKRCILGTCGVPHIERSLCSGVATSTPERRTAWLEDVHTMIQRYFPAPPHPTA